MKVRMKGVLISQAMPLEVRRSMLLQELNCLRYLMRQRLTIRSHQDLEGNLYQLLKLISAAVPNMSNWIKDSMSKYKMARHSLSVFLYQVQLMVSLLL